MNQLTLVQRIQNINAKEAALGISDEPSRHAKYKDSAYVYTGGIPFDLIEGDLLAVFAQFGEIVDVNLVRAFIAYEDQRSTNLAIIGRTIRVDHVSKYKEKEEEDEETEQRKREERGVCRVFQRGECNRGAGCKFSHDERRAANTGWGHEEDRRSRWANDKFEGSTRNGKQSGVSDRVPESVDQEGRGLTDKDSRGSRKKGTKMCSDRHYEHGELSPRDRGLEKRLDPKETDTRHRDDRNDLRDRESRRRELSPRDRGLERRLDPKGTDTRHRDDKNDLRDRESRRPDVESNSGEDRNRKDEKRSRKCEDESYKTEDRDSRGKGRRSTLDKAVTPS